MNRFLVLMMLFISGFVQSQVQPQNQSQLPMVSHSLISDIEALAQKCVVRVVKEEQNRKVAVGYKSNCSSLVEKSATQAQIFVNGTWYQAQLSESLDSDGGDLNNLTIVDQNGNLVASRKNVAAFGNILVALAGGDRFQAEQKSDD
jgi:hypothetical protein